MKQAEARDPVTITLPPPEWLPVQCKHFFGGRFLLLDDNGELSEEVLSTVEMEPQKLAALDAAVRSLASATRRSESARLSIEATDEGEEMVVAADPQHPERIKEILTAQMKGSFSAEEIDGYVRLLLSDRYHRISTFGFRVNARENDDGLWLELSHPSMYDGELQESGGGRTRLNPDASDAEQEEYLKRYRHLWRS